MNNTILINIKQINDMQINIAILYTQLCVICWIILLYLFIRVLTGRIVIPNKNYLLGIIVSVAGIGFFDCIWKWIEIDKLTVSIQDAYIICSGWFIMVDILSYFIVFYFHKSKRIKSVLHVRVRSVIVALLFIHIILNCLDFKTGWFFYINKDIDYKIGPLYLFEYIVPYGLIAICLMELIFFNLKKMMEEKNLKETDEVLDIYERPANIVAFYAMSLLFGMFGFIYKKVPIYFIGNTIIILLFYINLIEYFVKYDPLTKLESRKGTRAEVLKRINKVEVDFTEFYTIIMQLTNYNAIDEIYGKMDSDMILMRISNALRETASKYKKYNAYVSRAETTEFTILLDTKSDEVVERFIKDFREIYDIDKTKDNDLSDVNITYAYLRYRESFGLVTYLNRIKENLIKHKKNNDNTFVM